MQLIIQDNFLKTVHLNFLGNNCELKKIKTGRFLLSGRHLLSIFFFKKQLDSYVNNVCFGIKCKYAITYQFYLCKLTLNII